MLRRYLKRLYNAASHSGAYKPLNRIEISRSAMLHNVRLIQSEHPSWAVFPVLKGNAYGHGLALTAEILNDASGVPMMAVDGYFEAANILHVSKHPVLVMGYILPENVKLLDTRRCSFVVQDVAGLRAFGRLGKRVRVHVELNTGMNRLGLRPEELDDYLRVLKQFPQIQLEGVMTHLADADNGLDTSFTQAQAATFDTLVERILAAGFKPKYVHIAQTAGSTKVQSRHANAMRLGIGLYGINPLTGADPAYRKLADLQPVLELKSTIIKVLELQKGEAVSYGLTFHAPRDMRVAVLPLGYYEGVQRALSNKGCALTPEGRELPIVGRVCMDHTMVDVSGTALAPGDEVILISRDPAAANSVAGLERVHGLFPYSSLTGLSAIRRVITR